ncbi:60S acidic ribosomal protein P0 [Cichlidogyrus casuarinus]|uniref:60S acidic ribosomal protein P0 n=1 Tax=Cichlidogyrus casuarinus TaxID=1844966 RepID=A0ABD2Q208_9PLAT
MVQMRKKDRKQLYFRKLAKILNSNSKCFVVGIDNVRSQQMQQIRYSLRGSAEMVMGKNTMIKKCIRDVDNENVRKLLPLIKENVGLVFTNGDLGDVRDKIQANRIGAPAKAGILAQCDVSIEPQTTTLGPEKTSFFQALSIPTKINKGTIEILNKVNLIEKGTRVGASEAALLTMLKITPFTYGLEIQEVYDEGSIYPPSVLDIKPEDLIDHFKQCGRTIAALSMAINHPTYASVPHVVVKTFKKLLAISVKTDYTFKESESIKEYLKDPSKFAVAAAPAPAAGGGQAKAAEAKKPEPESESDEEMGMGLFD